MIELEEREHGRFYSEESYILLYTYLEKNRDAALVYFWLGRECPIVRWCTKSFATLTTECIGLDRQGWLRFDGGRAGQVSRCPSGPMLFIQ